MGVVTVIIHMFFFLDHSKSCLCAADYFSSASPTLINVSAPQSECTKILKQRKKWRAMCTVKTILFWGYKVLFSYEIIALGRDTLKYLKTFTFVAKKKASLHLIPDIFTSCVVLKSHKRQTFAHKLLMFPPVTNDAAPPVLLSVYGHKSND